MGNAVWLTELNTVLVCMEWGLESGWGDAGAQGQDQRLGFDVVVNDVF